MTISDPQVLKMVQQVLCFAPPIWLNHAEEHFLNNLDFLKPVQVKPGDTDLKLFFSFFWNLEVLVSLSSVLLNENIS